MKKIILTVLSAVLLFANASETSKIEAPKKEVRVPTEVKASKRASALEATLAEREFSRAERTKLREERLKKLDTDLAAKAEQRSSILY